MQKQKKRSTEVAVPAGKLVKKEKEKRRLK